MLGPILLIVLILLLLGTFPAWPYSRSWGYAPSGGLGLILIIVLILVLMRPDLVSSPRHHYENLNRKRRSVHRLLLRFRFYSGSIAFFAILRLRIAGPLHDLTDFDLERLDFVSQAAPRYSKQLRGFRLIAGRVLQDAGDDVPVQIGQCFGVDIFGARCQSLGQKRRKSCPMPSSPLGFRFRPTPDEPHPAGIPA